MRLALRNALILGLFYLVLCSLAFFWARWEVRDSAESLMKETAELLGGEVASSLNDEVTEELLTGGSAGRRALLDRLARLSRESSTILHTAVVDAEGEVFSSDRFETIGSQLLAPGFVFQPPYGPQILRQPTRSPIPPGTFDIGVPIDRDEELLGYVVFRMRSDGLEALYAKGRRRTVAFVGTTLALIGLLGLGLHLSLTRSSRDLVVTLESLLDEHPDAESLHGDLMKRSAEAAARLGEVLDSERAWRTEMIERTDRLERLLDVGLVVLDPADRIEFATFRAAELLHLPSRDLLRRERPEAPRALRSLLDHVHGASPRPAEFEWIDEATGDSWTCRVVPLADGTVVEFRDHEARRAVELDLQQAVQLRSLTRVYMGMAHDLRAPLNGIVLNLELAKRYLRQEAERGADVSDPEHRFDLIQREVERLGRTLEVLLAQALPSSQSSPQFDLSEVLDEIAALLGPQARHQEVELETDIAPAIEIDGRRDQVKQALLNVAINGLEAIPDEGRLSLALTRSEDRALVTITDTGPGIPPGKVDRIFEMHYSTKESGTGIGLYVSRSILQAHGGTIEVDSGGLDGTTFRISLPVAAPSAPPPTLT